MNTQRKCRSPLILLSVLLGAAVIATRWAQSPTVYAAATGQLQGQVLGGGPSLRYPSPRSHLRRQNNTTAARHLPENQAISGTSRKHSPIRRKAHS
jgi:hypothetical protein